MITTYTELKDEVGKFAHRSDLAARMDTFCQLAEGMINRDLRSQEMEKRESQTFNASFFDLPTDYLEMRALEMEISGARVPLRQVTPQVLDGTYSQSTGHPRAFTIVAGQLEFSPGIEASDPYTGELVYFAKVPTLTSNSTNDVLTATPMIYLAAMMVQVSIFTQDNDQLAIWTEAYTSQTASANSVATSGRYILPSIQVS